MFVKPLAADLPGIQFKRPITVSVKKNLSIKEHLLTSATDMVECLRTDPFGAFCQPQCDLCKPSSFANPPLPPSPLRALSPAALSSSALSYCSRE